MKILSWALVNAITRFYQGLSSEATTCSLSQDSRCPVLLSYKHLHLTYVKGICNQCLSVSQALIHFIQCYVACLNVRQTPKLTAGDTGDAVHLFHLFSQSWNDEDCSSFRCFFFFPSFWFFKMKFMRRREGLIMESRDVIIKHWRSLLRIAEPFLLLQDTAEAGVTASIVLVCPAGE